MNAVFDLPAAVWVGLISAAALIGVTLLQIRAANAREDKIRTDAEEDREADRQHQLALAEQQHRKDLHLAWRVERVAAYRDFRSVAMEFQELLRNNHGALDIESIEEVKAIDRALFDQLRDARSEVFLIGGVEVVNACDKAAVALHQEYVLRVLPRARKLRADGKLDPLVEDPMTGVDAAVKHFTDTARKELGVTELDDPTAS